MDNTVKVWDLENEEELFALPHPGMVWNVTISPDGKRIYTGSGGGPWDIRFIAPPDKKNPHIRVFDMNTGKELRLLEGHTGWVQSLGLSADGRFLVSGSMDGSVRLWGAK